MRNANDDSKRNSKELQPKIDDAPRRAEKDGKDANVQGAQKMILVSTKSFLVGLTFAIFKYTNAQNCRIVDPYARDRIRRIEWSNRKLGTKKPTRLTVSCNNY